LILHWLYDDITHWLLIGLDFDSSRLLSYKLYQLDF
jgi:hypothetical protein